VRIWEMSRMCKRREEAKQTCKYHEIMEK